MNREGLEEKVSRIVDITIERAVNEALDKNVCLTPHKKSEIIQHALQEFDEERESEDRLITTKICMTKDVGVNGHLFGGNMMAWIDEAGATFACQICSDPRMVTIKVDELIFKQPVKVGQHIKFYGSIVRIGESSIEVRIEVNSHNVRTGNQQKVCETNLTFVRISEYGETLPISKDVKDRYKEYVEQHKTIGAWPLND